MQNRTVYLGKDKFKNPKKLPINELFLEYKTTERVTTTQPCISLDKLLKEFDGHQASEKWKTRYKSKVEQKPAIDECWVLELGDYTSFQPFYPQLPVEKNNLFLEKNYNYLHCLLRLLNSTYHEFWCRVVCRPQTIQLLFDFLENPVSPFAVGFMNEEFSNLYEKIQSCILSIYERFLKFKVSETEYMSDETALGYLKSTGLLSIQSILLLCHLYNDIHPTFIRKLINFYFNRKYKEDYVRELTDFLVNILDVLSKLEIDPSKSISFQLSSKLNISESSNAKKYDPVSLEQTSFYVLEMVASLHEFFSVCKPAVEVAVELNLPHRLGHAYQKIYTRFYNEIENECDVIENSAQLQMLIEKWLNCGREEFVDLFHGLACHYVDKILEVCGNDDKTQKCLEAYMDLVSVVLEDHAFIKDYHKVHPLDAHFKVLIDNIADFDKTQADYFLNSLNRIPPEDMIGHKAYKKPETEFRLLQEPIQNPPLIPRHEYDKVVRVLTEYAKERKEATEEIAIKDLPPHVAEVVKMYYKWRRLFIQHRNEERQQFLEIEEIAAQNYEFPKPSEEEIERNIQTVLGVIPDLGAGFILKCLELMDYRPELVISRVLDDNLPPDLDRLPRDLVRGSSVDVAGSSSGIPVLKKEVKPKFIAHVGKKPEYSDAKQLLDDKVAKQEMKPLVIRGVYTYESDDDFDDTFEVSFPIGEIDEDKIYRHLKSEINVQEYETSSSSSDTDVEGKPRDAFCEDPAKVRARREEQRARKQEQRTQNYKKKEWNRNTKEKQTEQNKNEKSDKSLQNDRHKKNVHKGSKANHNRKGNAQWKRNKGMVPT